MKPEDIANLTKYSLDEVVLNTQRWQLDNLDPCLNNNKKAKHYARLRCCTSHKTTGRIVITNLEYMSCVALFATFHIEGRSKTNLEALGIALASRTFAKGAFYRYV